MRFRFRLSALPAFALVLAGLATPAAARADLLVPERFSVAGFGTVGLVSHDGAGLEWRRSLKQGRGARGDTVDLGLDSRLGLQLRADLGADVAAVVQGRVGVDAAGRFRPRLTRAFVRYAPDAVAAGRAGRIGMDLYLLADSPDVGYSYLPVRPPAEFFGLAIGEDFDGADATFARRIGDGVLSLRLFGGRSRADLAFGDSPPLPVETHAAGVFLDWSHGGWLLRGAAAQFQTEGDRTTDPLVALLRGTGIPAAAAFADAYASPRATTRIWHAGIGYDDGPLQARLLLMRLDSRRIVAPEVDTATAIVGYRVGALTPYASGAVVDGRARILPTGLPRVPGLAEIDIRLVYSQQASSPDQWSAAVGVRWDFAERACLKLQVDRVAAQISPLLHDRRPVPGDRAAFTAASLALDFTF